MSDSDGIGFDGTGIACCGRKLDAKVISVDNASCASITGTGCIFGQHFNVTAIETVLVRNGDSDGPRLGSVNAGVKAASHYTSILIDTDEE